MASFLSLASEDNIGAPNVTSLLTEVAGKAAYGTCLGRGRSYITLVFEGLMMSFKGSFGAEGPLI